MTRRRFAAAAGSLGFGLLPGCAAIHTEGSSTSPGDGEPRRGPASAGSGRLRSRLPHGNVPPGGKPGLHHLGLDDRRDALLLVPSGYREDRPAPFLLMLHGAGGRAESGLAPLRFLADSAGLLLAVPSRGRTWDILLDRFGPDITFIGRALAAVFSRYAVDRKRLGAAGFSDGASYALSIGLTNGDLFTHVLAFSPGFMAPEEPQGQPRVYVSHGTRDTVLPIDRCSRRIVPRLKQAGYAVDYREFEGGHRVPPEIARGAVAWFRGNP